MAAAGRSVVLLAAGFVLGASFMFISQSGNTAEKHESPVIEVPHQVVVKETHPNTPDIKVAPPTEKEKHEWVVNSKLGGSVTWFQKLTLADKEKEFYRYVRSLHTDCHGMTRFGRISDGGWEVCQEPAYQLKPPCLIYSFGINNLWDFDDASASKGCEVHSFDPSMGKGDFMRGEKIHFHNLGLDGFNGTDKRGWKMKTLGAIRKDLGHTEATIDILKMDIEFSEWAAFAAAFQENSLRNVKQLMFEVHTSMMVAIKRPLDDMAYVNMYRTFKELENLGFKLYWSTTNIQDRHQSPTTGLTRFCCFEIYWLNTKYRKS